MRHIKTVSEITYAENFSLFFFKKQIKYLLPLKFIIFMRFTNKYIFQKSKIYFLDFEATKKLFIHNLGKPLKNMS